MNQYTYKYNSIVNDIIYIKSEFKKKGQEYGIIKVNKNLINVFVEAIDLMSVSSTISSKFSEKLEKFIMPRFMELNEIAYTEKSLPTEIGVELSKENQKEMLNALSTANVVTDLESKGYPLNELKTILKNTVFSKQK